MAWWNFSKRDNKPEPETVPEEPQEEDLASVTSESDEIPASIPHDAVHGNSGPFDGDSVNIEDFDFSDYASGILDLRSMKIPLSQGAQVQIEMGETGPRMIHIVTTAGRITPVAFAAPKASGQWESVSQDLLEGINEQGMPAHFERGPWGREIVGEGPQAIMRIIGIDGPRWMLRLSLGGPKDTAEELATIAREMAARIFIYRGSDPILAGSSLPVAVPAQLAQQLQAELKRRQAQIPNPTAQPAPKKES